MDPHLRSLAARQADVVAAWQLVAAGWSRKRISHNAHRGGWRALHRGMYVLSAGPVRREQLWFAAALSTPDSVLSHGSASACWGFHRFDRGFEVVTRPGRGGRRRHAALLVFRRALPEGDVTRRNGLPITTAARTLVDIAVGLEDKRLGRAFREAVRLRTTTATRVLECADRHRGRPGAWRLGALASRYATIPYERTRSDAEGRGLEVLFDAGAKMPLVNVRVAGEEADLVDPDRGVILEIDGPQYHQFRAEDERKAAAWRKAGFEVRRIASDAVYAAPQELVARYSRSTTEPGTMSSRPESSQRTQALCPPS